jgi:Rhodanese-related sulfurtransferase
MKRLLVVALLLAAQSLGAQSLVSTEWLQAHRSDRRLILLEAGDGVSYEKSHIAGARLVSMSDVVTSNDASRNELPPIDSLTRTFGSLGIGPRDRIIIYSRDLIHAARVFFTLDYLGYGNQSSLLDGGFAKWVAENRPTQAGPPPATTDPSSFQPHIRVEAIVRLHGMRTLVNWLPESRNRWAIVDARSPEQYSGLEPGAEIRYGGHIEGAVNVPWQENLTGGATPVFRPPEDLRTLYATAGVPAEASVVVYCRTGMQATVNYFVLRMLGRDVGLYDGSWIEWSKAASHPAR